MKRILVLAILALFTQATSTAVFAVKGYEEKSNESNEELIEISKLKKTFGKKNVKEDVVEDPCIELLKKIKELANQLEQEKKNLKYWNSKECNTIKDKAFAAKKCNELEEEIENVEKDLQEKLNEFDEKCEENDEINKLKSKKTLNRIFLKKFESQKLKFEINESNLKSVIKNLL